MRIVGGGCGRATAGAVRLDVDVSDGLLPALADRRVEGSLWIQQTTGKSPEEMEPEELDQAMAQAGIAAQPVTPEDQQAIATAEADDPDPDEEVEAPE